MTARCVELTAAHCQFAEVREYAFYLGARTFRRLLCGPCAERLQSMGYAIERRREAVRPAFRLRLRRAA